MIEVIGPGVKYDDNKADWSLLPLNAAEAVVRVLMFGASKYGRDNWQRLVDFDRRYYNAAMRHVSARWRGEIMDDESGLPHMAHATCCNLFFLEKELSLHCNIGDPTRFRKEDDGP